MECSMDTQHEPAAWTRSMDMKHRNSALCSSSGATKGGKSANLLVFSFALGAFAFSRSYFLRTLVLYFFASRSHARKR
jgi:hypothetical protein